VMGAGSIAASRDKFKNATVRGYAGPEVERTAAEIF